MGKYVLQRVLLMLLTLLIITFMCFVLVRMLPLPVLPTNDPHSDVIAARREAMGYNKPYLVQFGIFLKRIFTGWDWGVSDKLFPGQEVGGLFLSKLPATMVVNIYSIVLSIPIGIALGVWAALKKNTWIDHTISTLTMVTISVPSFVFAVLLQYFMYYKWSTPINGFLEKLHDFFGASPDAPWKITALMKGGTDWFSVSMFFSILMPVLSMSFGVIAGFMRTTRAELTEVLTSEFMLLARTKGLTRAQATVRHAFKNCMVVVVPSIFGQFIGILGGSLIIERIFSIPGVGQMYLNSINGPDYPIFMMLTVFYTAIGLVAGIVVDISYGFIDPRIRMGSKK